MSNYQKALAEAQEAVKDVADVELRKIGFEVILKQLLNAEGGVALQPAGVVKAAAPQESAVPTGTNVTGLTADDLNTLFEIKDDIIALKVRPTGKSVPDQQQELAHAVLIGYKALLGKDSVTAKKIGAVARGWNLLDTNFGRAIQAPGHIQSKGKRGNVTYSLRPGALNKLRESMQKLARGE